MGTKKTDTRDYNAELLKEIQKVSGSNINVTTKESAWSVSYDVPGDEHIEIHGPSLEVIAKAMLFMRLAVEFNKLIKMKKSHNQNFIK